MNRFLLDGNITWPCHSFEQEHFLHLFQLQGLNTNYNHIWQKIYFVVVSHHSSKEKSPFPEFSLSSSYSPHCATSDSKKANVVENENNNFSDSCFWLNIHLIVGGKAIHNNWDGQSQNKHLVGRQLTLALLQYLKMIMKMVDHHPREGTATSQDLSKQCFWVVIIAHCCQRHQAPPICINPFHPVSLSWVQWSCQDYLVHHISLFLICLWQFDYDDYQNDSIKVHVWFP